MTPTLRGSHTSHDTHVASPNRSFEVVFSAHHRIIVHRRTSLRHRPLSGLDGMVVIERQSRRAA